MEGCDMDFSDIRTIIIGEAGEYGKRLVRYLEIHLSSAVRVYHFTTAEGMVSFKEEAEIYLLDERFFKELSEEKQKFLKQKKLILLTWREEQGSFCKYDNPQKLLDMLSDFTDYNSDLSDLAAELKDTPTKLTIVYSPVYDEYLEQIARSFMSSGDVYMGAEDLGYKGIDSEYEESGDMGDLCYYIHLREENILDLQKRMEALFAWMLPQIDYEDTDAVQFMYRFYNKVRKLGFSKELLETYIQTKRQKEYYDIEEVDKTSEKVRDSSKIKQDRRSNNESISYEEFFKEELELEKQKIESPNNRKQKTGDFQIGIKNGKRNSRQEVQRKERNRDEKNKNQSNRNQKNKDLNNRSKSQSNENNYLIVYNGLKIISVICTFLAVILEGIFVFYGMRSGFTRQLFQYSVGGILLIIVFACGFIWSTQTVRKIKQMSDEFIHEKELQNRPQMIKTEVDWETEGDWESGTEGTTILNYGNESEKEDGKICNPMLRDMELGIIYVIKNCPFYIGSAEGVNHLHIQDKTVSREHAVILEDIYEGDGQGYILRDMGSTNGTWLNGKKIKRGNQEQLEDGAVIRFAKKEYEFLIQDI